MLLALLGACRGGVEAPAYTATDLAADLAGHVQWSHPADWPGVQPSCEASHGEYVQIWQNAAVDADLAAGRAFSTGAIFVAQAYQDSSGTPKMEVAMRKQADGTWFWGHYDESGTQVEAGSIAACAACHASGSDHVRHVGVTPPLTSTECGGPDTGGWDSGRDDTGLHFR